MFIPIAFSIAPMVPQDWLLGHFLKMMDFASKYQCPIISQEQYFDYAKRGEHCNDVVKDSLEFDISVDFTQINWEELPVIAIPKEIEDNFISQFPSTTDAYLASMTENWPEIETYIVRRIREIQEENGKKVQALISFHDNKFLRNIANLLECDVIYYEFSAVRPPNYNQSLYYTGFQGLYGNLEIYDRYKVFTEDQATRNLPFLSNKELVSFFIREEQGWILDYINIDAPYEVGVASKGITINGTFPFNKINDAEMVNKAIDMFNKTEVLFKPRWTGMNGEVLPVCWQQIDVHDGNLLDFIIKSKRVLCAGSNIALDAVLLGRPAYDVGYSHNAIISNASLDHLDDNMPDEKLLSFIVFSMLVPSELFWDQEYLQFRMSRPAEIVLYKYHFEYLLAKYSLDENFIQSNAEERIANILQARGISYEKLRRNQNIELKKNTKVIRSVWEFDINNTGLSDKPVETYYLYNPDSQINMTILIPSSCRRIIWHISYEPCVLEIESIAFAINGKAIKMNYYPIDAFIEKDKIYFTGYNSVIVIENSEMNAFELDASVIYQSLTGVEAMQAINSALERKIVNMENSSSWRITALLRWLKKHFGNSNNN